MRAAGRTAVLGGAAVAAVAVSGFVRPASPFPGRPSGPAMAPVALPDHLPEVLRRHLDVDGDGRVPGMATVELWGRGRMRVAPGVWLPLRMRTQHRLGEAFVPDIELHWHERTVVRATEAFVDGRGWSQQGPNLTVGPEIDQGANLFLWSEALLIPALYATARAPTVEELGPGRLQLGLPFGDGVERTVLRFAGTHPARFSAQRYKGVGYGKVDWHVSYAGWREVEGLRLPDRVEVRWGDEPGPWFRFERDGFAANVDVGRRLAEVSAQLPPTPST
jgi:hypothetical protein